jgi:hypothetical protein
MPELRKKFCKQVGWPLPPTDQTYYLLADHFAVLSKDVFTQLIFGFRSVTWAIIQPGQQIPVELIPILNVLFPRCEGRIAGSDFF